MPNPIEALLTAGGFEIIQPTAAYAARDHTKLVFSALRKIGVADDLLPYFADKVAKAGHAAGPRDVYTHSRMSAHDIESAAASIEDGLRLIAKGFTQIEYARSTVSPASQDRQANLALMHAALIGSVADAVAKAIGESDALAVKIADSVPDYGPLGFSNPWRSVFSIAAGEVSRIRLAFPKDSYRAQKRDRSAWLCRLIPQLALVYREATGKRPTVSNPSEKATKGWRSPFPQFVEDLWGYLDVTDGKCPGDDQIKAAYSPTISHPKTT